MEQNLRDTNWNLIKELEQKTKELENIKDQNIARIIEFDKKIEFILDQLHISCNLI